MDSNALQLNFSSGRYLAIDETDRMVEQGHFQELTQLLELINNNETAKKHRQTFVFSATLTMVHSAPKRLQLKKKVNLLYYHYELYILDILLYIYNECLT